MFTQLEIIDLQRYLQKILERPRRIQDQPNQREGIFVWCEDWEITEILKYFFNGAEAYAGDPPPNRLKFNPLWSKEDIARKAEALIETHKSAAGIIAALQARRG